KGAGTRTKGGTFYSYRPHYYWLPVLGLLVGGRLNELAQLYLSDIRTSESGVHYLDFNLEGEGKVNADKENSDAQETDAQDKSLKTINATRQVPIHPMLQELGFIDYVVALRGAGYKRLFPELRHDKVKGYGKHAGSWFNERFLGNQLKIERNGRKTFHSFRHNFSTALGDSDTPPIIKSQLMGHSRGTAENESRYDKGRRIDQLAEHLSRIDFGLPNTVPFLVAEGLQAASDAIKLKVSRRPGKSAPA
ncbi:site-specific integrase, partial [Roseateles sp. GG27B]